MTTVTGLPRYATFAAVLAAAGLPIYIHAPKFYVDSYGVTLAQLSVALFLLRLIDLVQDPLLGRLAEITRQQRGPMVLGAGVIMAGAMLMLFAVPPMLPPVWWFALSLAALFSAFSFLTICFYAQGVAKAGAAPNGHVRLASWRETGSLIGVCIAAALPSILANTGAPFLWYAILFAAAAAVALLSMEPEWSPRGAAPTSNGLRVVLSDATARRLLLIALVNATPVAVTSTLFLFFVADRLGAPGQEGPLLLLFFLSAAVAVPVWGRLATRLGARRTLMVAMVLAIVTFAFALPLGTGDVWLFAGICIGSGAAVGADLSLLPALFARRMQMIAPTAADGFGLWSFVNKATLAVAAIALFPILDIAGFRPGEQNAPAALWSITILYAGVPLALKALALILIARTGPEMDT
ncbi:glycoside/pentoside/hexuronide:cation symporter, GPH family [Jannaschia faecimaris]|uniref:Glycoside/pentoside/hexuronide:cation symporter, GPH family n=1 Tax=Jannaschia faecimaris TaxID=1244108 RepID=A0A1H3PR59_9RHOB|nr:MFS transporter [Jannaschia faecimaris]SDZ03488.1 glycoside/pentoside/hexuronide:cation symporter, GPH family [Jannaschia faecimaris]